jgi:hypothetical protein
MRPAADPVSEWIPKKPPMLVKTLLNSRRVLPAITPS